MANVKNKLCRYVSFAANINENVLYYLYKWQPVNQRPLDVFKLVLLISTKTFDFSKAF